MPLHLIALLVLQLLLVVVKLCPQSLFTPSSPLSLLSFIVASSCTNFSYTSRTECVLNFCSNATYSKLSFQRVIIRSKRLPNKRVMPFLLRGCNLSRADFRTRALQCFCHNSLLGSSKFLILDALERAFDGASEYLFFPGCTFLNLCPKFDETAALSSKIWRC